MILSSYTNKLKIQGKLTLAIVLAVIIPFIILASIFSGKLYDMIIADTIRSAQISSAETSPLIDGVISDIATVSAGISQTAYFQEVFFGTNNNSLDDFSYTVEARQLKDTVDSLAKKKIIVKVYAGVPETCSIFSSSSLSDIILPMSQAQGTYWHGIFQSSKCSTLYCPARYLCSREQENYGNCAYITYMTANYQDQIYPCYLAVYYPSTMYSSILEEKATYKNGVSYIINEKEELVATTDEALSSTYRLRYSDISESLMASNSFIERDVLGSHVYVAFYYLSTTKWFIVTVIPADPLIDESTQVVYRFVFIVLCCVLLAIFVAILISKSITTRMASVIHQMGEVRNGPPRPMEDTNEQDEVGELIRTYNYMANEMQSLIEQEQRTAESLRIAEFNALQAQINPHFLYNTMDMINWMAKEGRNEEVSEVVQRLSRFYKLTLSKKNTINSISDELEHVSLYVQLQNMRHGDSIDLVIDMPDELSNFSIPKLTLQPIIENSIIHGIMEKEEKSGTIIITGWEEDDDIVILVSDDGVGIPPEKIGDILTEKPVAPSKGSNVAISNIHHRLKILYGPQYGLSYSSTLGEGTEVTIKIPELIG